MDSVGRRPPGRLRSTLKYLVLFAAACLLVILVASVILPNQDSIAAAREGLARYGLLLMCIRLALIGLLWLYWNPLLKWFYKDRAPKALAHLRSRRNYFAVVFLAVELLLIQNILGWFWRVVS